MIRLIFGITVVFFTILSSLNFSYAVNRVLDLDGDGDSVQILDNEVLRLSDTDFTLEAWIYQISQNYWHNAIIVKRTRESQSGWFWATRGEVFPPTGHLFFQISGGNDPLVESSTTIPLKIWTHVSVVFTKADQTVKMFINGRLDAQKLDMPIPNPTTTATLRIGTDSPGVDEHLHKFHGEIDEVRIWNIARSQEEIQATMDAKLHGDEEGLVGYWNFDDGTADDLSPYGNNGTLMGDAQIIPPLNRALAFDGDGDSVQVSDNEALRLSNTDFTLEAWVYETARASRSDAILVKRGGESQDGWFWSITGESGGAGHLFYNVSGGGDPYVLSSAIIPLNTWTHVAVVFTEANQTVNMFIDGNLDTTQSGIPTPNPTTTATLAIGNDSPESGQPYSFHGEIDEVRIWDRALTRMEIYAQKDAILNGDEPGLVGYWRMDEPPGSTIAYDSSGNGNDGTLYGDADFVVSDAPLSTGALVSISSVSGQRGETVDVPVIVENITNIVSLDLLLSYDDNILTPGVAETTDLTTEWQIDSYTTTPGAFNISIVNHSQVTEDGEMINIPFTVDASAPVCTTMPITIEEALLNEGHIPVTTFDGIFSVNGRLGDVSLNGTITGYDAALVLQHTVQIITLTDCQQSAADVDISGEITAYDAAMILQYVVGRIPSLPGESLQAPAIANVTENDARLFLPYVDFGGNQPITVPITIEQKTPLVSAIELTLSCGNLKPIKVQKTALTNGYALAYNIQNGEIKISLAGSEPVKQNGAFVTVEFEPFTSFEGRPQSQPSINQLKISHIRLNRNLMQSVVTNSNIQIPQRTALLQNFPNPFNPETWIPYQLKEEAEVVIHIYNIKGEIVRTLSIGRKPAGSYLSREKTVFWNGKNQNGEAVANGLYFYTLKAGGFQATRKMILVK